MNNMHVCNYVTKRPIIAHCYHYCNYVSVTWILHCGRLGFFESHVFSSPVILQPYVIVFISSYPAVIRIRFVTEGLI